MKDRYGFALNCLVIVVALLAVTSVVLELTGVGHP